MANKVLSVVQQSFVGISDDGNDITLPGNAASATQTLDHTYQAPSGDCGGYPTVNQKQSTLFVQGPGRNFGNAGGWSIGKAEGKSFDPDMVVSQRGIHQFKSFVMEKHAVGDTALLYGILTADGGIHGQSDEGVTGISLRVSETPGYFHGTVVSSTGPGDIKPTFAFTSGVAKSSDGAFMLNISKATIAGNIQGPSQPLYLNATAAIVEKTFLNYLPVTKGILPISEAIGICDSPIAVNNHTADSPQPVTIPNVRLAKINGVPGKFTVGSYVTVGSDSFPEQAKLTAVVDNPDGTQTLGMNLRNPSGKAIIFQGPLTGKYISLGANLRFSGMRSTYFALGSTTGDDLIYAVQVGGGVANNILPMIGNEAATNDGGSNSDILLVPGAEVVCTNDNGFDCILEQNNVLWEAGDIVENPHYPIGGGITDWITKTQFSPSSPGYGGGVMQRSGGGPGFGGSNTFLARFKNENPPSMYLADGGPLVAPGGVEMEGPFRNCLYSECGPQPGGSIVFVQKRVGDLNAPVAFGTINDAAGASIWFVPPTQTWKFDGPIDAPSLSSRSSLAVGGTASFVNNQVQIDGTNDYAELVFNGVFNKGTQRIRVCNGGFPLNTNMYFDSLITGGFNFRIPDSNDTLQTPVAIDAAGLHTPGVVEAASFKTEGVVGGSGSFTDKDGKVVTFKNGLFVGAE